MASDTQGDNLLSKEWDTARDILNNTDEHMHDLRKYGFTFFTALLATESFLIPNRSANIFNVTILPDEIKVAVLGVTLVLIIALQLIDRNYQVLQEAAATRALVLERTLNLELTEVISLRYNIYHVKMYVGAIYGLFVLGVLVLGGAVLFPNWLLIGILSAVAFIAWISIFLFFNISYPFGYGDWTIDRLECKPGDDIGITVTNLCSVEEIDRIPCGPGDEIGMSEANLDLKENITIDKLICIPTEENKDSKEKKLTSKKAIRFPPNQVLWALVKEHDKIMIKGIKADTNGFILNGGDSYVWMCKIPKEILDIKTGLKVPIEEGIYELWRAVPKYKYRVFNRFLRRETGSNTLKPLARKLRIKKNSQSS
jgi:hypothetical protein